MLFELGQDTAVNAGEVVLVIDDVVWPEVPPFVPVLVVVVDDDVTNLAPAIFAFGTAAPKLDFR